MKFTVTMKDPDGVYESIEDAVKSSLANSDLDEDEREALLEVRREKVKEICGQWFVYDEYLYVEVDTEAGTCVVLPAK
jgi:hypothetical protein